MQPTNLFQWTLHSAPWPDSEQPGFMIHELVNEWFELLDDARLPIHTMNAEQADGYLTACFLSPELLPFAAILGAIFGQDELPLCEDVALQERVLKLTVHRWHDIQNRLGKPLPTPEEAQRLFTPIWSELEEGALISPYKLDAQGKRLGEWPGKRWAHGFLEGVRADESWEYLVTDGDNFSLVAPFALLELGHNPEKPELQVEEIENFQLHLIKCLYEIRSYWKKNRRAALAYVEQLEDEELSHIPYLREAPKVGRNDPCICGSGKKYKKCCGA